MQYKNISFCTYFELSTRSHCLAAIYIFCLFICIVLIVLGDMRFLMQSF